MLWQFVMTKKNYLCKSPAKKSQESTTTNVGKQSKNAVESEFISDAFQATDKDLDEVKAGMKLLGIDSLTSQSNKNAGKTFIKLRTRIALHISALNSNRDER